MIVQELYNFFSASTYRWDVLKQKIDKFSLKPLSDTRWESRINALIPLKQNLNYILDALTQISDETKDQKTKSMAKSLANKICSYKFICSLVIWHAILERINIVSKMLQSPHTDLGECVEALKNLKEYLLSKRNDQNFDNFLNESFLVANKNGIETEFPEVRVRKKPRLFNYESCDESVMNPSEKFKIHFYFEILDISINSVSERFELLEHCYSFFNFLLTLHSAEPEYLRKCCMDLDIKLGATENGKFKKDLDGTELYNELLSFRNLFPTHCQLKPLAILNYLISQDLVPCFPNFCISLRIFLTIPISVASGERSFSKLKLIKNYLRSTISQERCTNLAIISIESEICEAIDISNLIEVFASKKARKVLL